MKLTNGTHQLTIPDMYFLEEHKSILDYYKDMMDKIGEEPCGIIIPSDEGWDFKCLLSPTLILPPKFLKSDRSEIEREIYDLSKNLFEKLGMVGNYKMTIEDNE